MKTIETLDNRPFRRLITTIGALPTSFIDSMSYYEMLAWFCDFLQNTVIPAVNDNAEALAELQRLFVELKEYVDNYFANLDVQEEINNKLDEMAEAGTLTDIIAQYLTLAGVLAFSTVTDLANAENLAIGSKAKTYGYIREGDGVYDLYTVREILNTDVVDGYNIVALTNTEDLVAERMQSGKELVINLKTTDDLQTYLNLKAKKVINLPTDTTYTVTSSVFINSDTVLDLNNSTLVVNTNTRPIIFMYGLTDTFTGYDGYKNIIVRNGTITGACVCLMHNKNVRIENISFFDPKTTHAIQIAGSYDVNISGCTFNGSVAFDEVSCELINIDPCNYGGQPYMSQDSVMYDHTANKYIVIENNTFKKSEDGTNRYTNGVGSHGYDDERTNVYCKHIIIRNNDFGSPYTSCINTSTWDDITIENNTCNFETTGTSDTTYAIKMRAGVNGMYVNNNSFINPQYFIYSGEDLGFTKYNIQVTNNIVTTLDTTSHRAISWFNVKNSVIKDNILNYKQNAVFLHHLSSEGVTVEGSKCENIDIVGNVFNKTDATSNQCIRILDADTINIIDNNFPYTSLTSQAGYAISITPETATNVTCTGNTTKFPKTFIPTNNFISSLKLSNNNGFYEEVSGISTTSGTGTFNIPLTYFKELVLQIGDSTHANTVVIRPWLTSSNPVKFDTTNRTYTLPIIKLDGTAGVMQFSITDNATKYSLTSDVNLRAIYAID